MQYYTFGSGDKENNASETKPSYGYDFSKIHVDLWVNESQCIISADKRDDKMLQDALRKLHLIYAIKYNKCFDLKLYSINGDLVSSEKSKKPGPEYHSMLEGCKDFHLTRWSNDDKGKIIDVISKSTKSDSLHDYSFICLYHFFLSRATENPYHKFNSLWIAINAFYNALYEICTAYVCTLDKDAQDFFNDELCRAKITDSDLIYMMEGWIHKPKFFGTKNQKESFFAGEQYEQFSMGINRVYKECNNDNKIWEKIYNFSENLMKRIEESTDDSDKSVKDFINEQLENFDFGSSTRAFLCNNLYALNKGKKNTVVESNESHELSEINNIHEDFSLFLLFLLEYPYHWRNQLFHAKRYPPIFYGDDDAEIATLNMLNYFLDRFVEERLPEMFAEYPHVKIKEEENKEEENKNEIGHRCLHVLLNRLWESENDKRKNSERKNGELTENQKKIVKHFMKYYHKKS